MLALSGLQEIDCIIDSAIFKQGMYSPITNIKIISPETLKDSKIDLLIIMVPGIYPDEVVKKVKKMKLNIHLAKLKDNKIEFI